jgi:hypothetical protein
MSDGSHLSHYSRGRARRLVFAAVVALAVLAGLLASHAWVPGPGLLYDMRQSLHNVAGVLLFGAGLLHLSADRLGGLPSGPRAGLVLLLLGVLVPRMSALGPALHRDPSEAVLSPWTAGVMVVVVLAVDAGLEHAEGSPTRPPTTWRIWLGGAAAVALLLLLAGPLLVHRAGIGAPNLPDAAHVALELAVAALWLARAAHARRTVGVGGLRTGVLAALGLTWAIRALAVADLSWSLVAASLLTATGLGALVVAARAFLEVTEAREVRFALAEEALAAAEQALAEIDGQRRSLRHDARNSMFALRGAARVLLDHDDHLDAATRNRLRQAVADELGDLETLLTQTLPRPRATA